MTAFADRIKEAVAAKDLEALADLTSFPVYVGLPDTDGAVNTREDFLALGAAAGWDLLWRLRCARRCWIPVLLALSAAGLMTNAWVTWFARDGVTEESVLAMKISFSTHKKERIRRIRIRSALRSF